MKLKNSKPKTSNEQANIFVDRDEPRADFERRLQRQPDAVSPVVVYHGVGGVGKSSLCRAVIERLLKPHEIPFAIVDYDYDDESRSAEKTFSRIRRQLGKFGMKFPAFDLVWARYFEETTGQKISPSLVPAELQDAANVVSLLPLLGNLTQAAAGLANLSKSAFDWFTHRYKDGWAQRLLHMNARELVSEMPSAMARDIEDAMLNAKYRGKQGQWRITVIFDGYERLAEHRIDDWWVREFCGECGSALVVICGRDKLQWEKDDSEWSECVEHYPALGNLSSQDADDYLRQCQIESADLRKYIVELTDGFPYHLELAANLCAQIELTTNQKPAIADFEDMERSKDLGAKLLDRFLRQLRPDEEDAAMLAAIPRWFTSQILETLLSAPESASRLFRRIISFSFCEPVSNIPGAYTLRKEPRKILKEQASKRPHWKYWNERLRDYHQEQQIKAIDPDVKFRHQLEELYHWIEVNPSEAIGEIGALMREKRAFYRYFDCQMIVVMLHEHGNPDPVFEAQAKIAESNYWQMGHRDQLKDGTYMDKSLNLFEEAIEILRKHAPAHITAQVFWTYGYLLEKSYRYDDSLRVYNQALRAAEKTRNQVDRADVLYKLASLDYIGNPHTWDCGFLREALNVYVQENIETRIATTMCILSRAYIEHGDPNEAEKWAKEAIIAAQKTRNKGHLTFAYIRMADAKKMRGQVKESITNYHEALKLSEELGHMGFAAWILRELASLALSKDDTNLAYNHLQDAFQMELKRDTRWGVGRSLYDISVYYVYIKEYDAALNYLLIANAIFHKIQHNNISKSEALLAQIRETLGQEKFDQIVSNIDINQSEYKKYF